MNHESLSNILEGVGGKSNITYVTHCMTRLRINLKDHSKVDIPAIKKIDGVLGAQFSGEQFQIVIGQHVDEVYSQFIKIAEYKGDKRIEEETSRVSPNSFTLKSIPNKVIDVISGCVTPILPIITASGLIKLIYAVLGADMLNIVPETSDFMVLIKLVGDAGFYFFPIFVAWSASKKFNTNTPIALLLGGVLIHPMLLDIVQQGEAFKVYGIPMQLVNYSSQFLPSILIVWLMSYIYNFFDRYSPTSLKIIIVPTATILVMLPIALTIVAPLGNMLGSGLALLFTQLHTVMGPVAIGIVAALWCFLVATGMHQALIVLAITAIGVNGADNLILVGGTIAIYALMGLGVSYLIRCKKEDRALASSNAITMIVAGISEPTIFSLLLQNKKAMIIQVIAGFVGGFVAGLLNVQTYFFGASNLLAVLAFGKDLKMGIVICALTFIISLLLGLLLGFDDSKILKKNKF